MAGAAFGQLGEGRMKRSGAITFPATEADARAGIQTVTAGLQAQGLGPDMLGNVEIALAEAVNNIVEHAYSDRQAGQIRLRYEFGDGALILHLEDDGAAISGGRAPPGRPADLDVATENMPEGGFGWFLIRSLTSRLSYRRQDGVNRLTLRFDLVDGAAEG